MQSPFLREFQYKLAWQGFPGKSQHFLLSQHFYIGKTPYLCFIPRSPGMLVKSTDPHYQAKAWESVFLTNTHVLVDSSLNPKSLAARRLLSFLCLFVVVTDPLVFSFWSLSFQGAEDCQPPALSSAADLSLLFCSSIFTFSVVPFLHWGDEAHLMSVKGKLQPSLTWAFICDFQFLFFSSSMGPSSE